MSAEVADYVLDGILQSRFWIVPDQRHADVGDYHPISSTQLAVAHTRSE